MAPQTRNRLKRPTSPVELVKPERKAKAAQERLDVAVEQDVPIQACEEPKESTPIPDGISTPALQEEPEAHNPLQDITDRFYFPATPSHNTNTPARNHHRRKPKIPSSMAKLQMVQEAAPTRQLPGRIASPLPPSSPPTESSRDIGDACFDDAATQPDISDKENGPHNNTPSDPFGFLAVERRLKAVREMDQAMEEDFAFETYSSDDDLYADENVAPVVIFPTPLPGAGFRNFRTGARAMVAISTPGGRERENKAIPSPTLSTTSSLPSPAKIPSLLYEPKDVVESPASLSDPRGDSDTENAPKPSSKAKGKQRRADETFKPEEIVRNLEALLPKRPKRGAKGKVVEEKGESEEKGAKRRRPRKPAMKGRSREKEPGKQDEGEFIDVELDTAEKWARERQARIEYFKKLEDYSFEKENVYII